MVWEKGMKNVSRTVSILFYLLMGWAAAAHAQGQAAMPEEEEPSSVPEVAVVLDFGTAERYGHSPAEKRG